MQEGVFGIVGELFVKQEKRWGRGEGVEPPYRVARRGEMMYDIP